MPAYRSLLRTVVSSSPSRFSQSNTAISPTHQYFRAMTTNPVKEPSGATRDEPATTKQVDLAERLAQSTYVDADGVPASMSKGEASDFIKDAEIQTAAAGNPTNPVKIPRGDTREEPASNKQLAFADRLANSNAVDGAPSTDMTKGEVSDFIQDATKQAAAQTLSATEGAQTTATASSKDDAVPRAPLGVKPISIPRGADRDDPPTQKQRNLAERLAAAGKIDPSELHDATTKGEMSDVITKAQVETVATNPIKLPIGADRDAAPTKKQMDLAERLAAAGQVDASKLEQAHTKGEVSDFISEARKVTAAVNPASLPQAGERSDPATGRQHNLADQLGVSGHEGMTKGEISDAISEAQKTVRAP